MVTYRLDGASDARGGLNGHPAPQAPGSIMEYIAGTRVASNEYQHPIAVFDMNGQPVFRNTALATRVAAEQSSASGDRTWHSVYSMACRAAAEAVTERVGISTVLEVSQRSFVLLGSLLREPTGRVYGATVSIAEVTGAPFPMAETTVDESRVSEQDEAWQEWQTRRDESRTRMQRLSPRECEVVSRVAAGLPNKSIARELDISVKTIEKHRANAVRKLGVASTPEVVRIVVLADMDYRPESDQPEHDTGATPAQAAVAQMRPMGLDRSLPGHRV